MSDYFPGAIHIGGAVPLALAAQLAEKITDAGVSLEWGGKAYAPTGEGDLVDAVDAETKLLALYDDQAKYGAFRQLEEWLEQNQLAFTRTCDARYEWNGEVVSFRPGLGLVVRSATQNGEPMVLLEKLEPVRMMLRAAITEPAPEKVGAALAALDNAMGPDIPALTPMTIVDGAP